MADDISQISLPDGTTYDIVAKKVFMEGGGSIGTSYAPLIATWDNSDGNKDIIIPYNGPEVDLDTGNVRLKMENIDISNRYTITKTSGNWSVHDIQAYRCGNIVFANFILKGNGSAVSAGSNGFVGTITYGPLPILEAKLWTFSSSTIQSMNIAADGAITARNLIGSITFSSSTRAIFSGMFITND